MRKVHVNGEVWEYQTGKGWAVIRRSRTGKKTIVNYSQLTGRDWATIERGQWKRTSDGMITPAHIKTYIEKHLATKTK